MKKITNKDGKLTKWAKKAWKKHDAKNKQMGLLNDPNVRVLDVGGGQVSYISAKDYDSVKYFTWHRTWGNWYKKDEEGGSIVYALVNWHIDGKNTQVYLHRYLTGAPPNLVVDHIDGDGLNNTQDNLRVVTASVNQHNRKEHRRA